MASYGYMGIWESVLREILPYCPHILAFLLFIYMGISYMGIWPYKFNSIDLLNFFLVFHLKWVIRNLFLCYLMVLMILYDLVIL
jgi:hypothetical protein